jgi:nicotinamide-nucleotide amidase
MPSVEPRSTSSRITKLAVRSPEQIEFTRIDGDLVRCACSVMALAKEKGLSVITAESCTAGLIAAVLSEAPGAARHLQGGLVTYTKEQKTALLGVPADLLETKGAVCAEVCSAMAEGALRCSTSDVAVAVTGVAGPATDEDGNPVGLVYLAGQRRGASPIQVRREFGPIGRDVIRYRAVAEAMAVLAAALALGPPALAYAKPGISTSSR